MTESGEPLSELEERLGYAFKDRSLLSLALTHGSFRNEQPEAEEDNERFEFLGDAVLDLVIGNWLFENLPGVGEGVLTEKKAALVCESSLASFASGFGLGAHLRLGRGEELSGGRTKVSLLANSMEAVVAAVFLDAGFDRANSIVLAWFENVELAAWDEASRIEDPRSSLQILVQARFGCLPVYDVDAVQPEGPDPEFEARVEVPSRPPATGRARTKKGAMREAAAQMLAQIHALEQAQRVTGV